MATQLLPSDDGAFRWRGFMLDVARHFAPLAEVRRLIDGMALLRLNVLHLHLTDDQGWRFESKKWPKLTEVAAWRDGTLIGRPGSYEDKNMHPECYMSKFDGKRHGGFYTQDELRELVAYAKTKGITIVPEVDMPGHMRAARAAYPELGYDGKVFGVGRSWGVYPEVLRADERGLAFCRDILGEICDVFDSPFIHIGGDECPKAEWIESPTANEQLKALGETGGNMEVLQRWFTSEIATYLATLGRRLIGWDEIIDGGVPSGKPVAVCWRDWTDAARRATDLGVQIVQAPARLYFDYTEGPEKDEPLSIGQGADLKTVYEYDPYSGVDPKHADLVLGLQAQVWSEYVPNVEHLWYMAFPRLIAVADIAYHGKNRPSYDGFLAGLPARLDELKKLGIGHHPLAV